MTPTSQPLPTPPPTRSPSSSTMPMPMSASAISLTISAAHATTSVEALPHEILHNLQYQHNWSDLRLHSITSTSNTTTTTSSPSSSPMYLISGTPPRPSYIHPDLLNQLVAKHVSESAVPIQREWVLPMDTGEAWTLRRFSGVFDALPERDPVEVEDVVRHQDVKRVLCAMKARDGFGGDGTVVYYIMQEGEVKPRQN